MHVNIRTGKVKPGQSSEVSARVEAEYVPRLREVEGFVAYTLVDLGNDEVRSFGIFQDEAAANRADEIARAWATERLAELLTAPLDTVEGRVMVDARAV